jgi:hypothetical protein
VHKIDDVRRLEPNKNRRLSPSFSIHEYDSVFVKGLDAISWWAKKLRMTVENAAGWKDLPGFWNDDGIVPTLACFGFEFHVAVNRWNPKASNPSR